jgi:hypothetical protein
MPHCFCVLSVIRAAGCVLQAPAPQVPDDVHCFALFCLAKRVFDVVRERPTSEALTPKQSSLPEFLETSANSLSCRLVNGMEFGT